MKLTYAVVALALSTTAAAAAQPVQEPVASLAPGGALLNVSAEGRSERRPDVAALNAGVVTQARTAGEAMSENSRRMDALIAALKRAGVGERDIQTSNLNLQPQYYYPQQPPPARRPDGSVATEPAEPQAPRIVGYEARNSVAVRVRNIADMGKIVDTLVSVGSNQIEGPYFSLDKPEAAADEARAQALRIAQARAQLYAREAGFRRARILSITEGGGYYPVAQQIVVTGSRGMGAAAPPPPPPAPVQPGEVSVGVSLSVQFALEP